VEISLLQVGGLLKASGISLNPTNNPQKKANTSARMMKTVKNTYICVGPGSKDSKPTGDWGWIKS
jgi:hypothetical protein